MSENGLSLAPLQSRYVVASTTGLAIEDISYQEWSALFDALRGLESCIQFWLGDCINYGKDHFSEDWYQAMPLGYEGTTLDNFALVARKVPSPRRREGVSYSHHVEVSNLAPVDQIAMLERVQNEELSVRALRQLVANGNPPPNGATPDPEVCPYCGQSLPHNMLDN